MLIIFELVENKFVFTYHILGSLLPFFFILLNKLFLVNNLNDFIITVLVLFLCLASTASLDAQIHVRADRNMATYEVGELMNFQVTSVDSGQVSYIIRRDNHAPILEKGSFYLEAGQTYNIPFSHDEPSFLLCYVNQGASSDRAGIAISPYQIQPVEREPSDFDAFWEEQKEEMRSIVSNPQLTPHSTNNYNDTYKLVMDHIDDRKVYGYISIPKGEGPFPAFLVMPSFGGGANHVSPGNNESAQTNAIVITLSIHNADPEIGDPDRYEPNDISTREGNYYRYGLMAGVRCIDYLFTRDDFDKQNLGVMGVSQGGGLSLIMAGLDTRIKMLVYSVPALCQHNGLRYDRTSGHPYFIFNSRTRVGTPEHEQSTSDAIRYYDAINFAKRYKGPSMFFLSYEDHVCPPGTGMAANNLMTGGPKIIKHSRETVHETPDYQIKRYDAIRNFMPATQGANGAISTDVGYDIITTADSYTTTVGSPVTLTSAVTLEDKVVDLSSDWEKLVGPGKAIFSTPTSSTTTISFDQPGTYTLKYNATDDRYIEETNRWVTIHNFITITVE